MNKITESTIEKFTVQLLEKQRNNLPVPFSSLCVLCGSKKYPVISRQYFNFWQPYFQMKKPYLHKGKVLFAESLFLHAQRDHSIIQTIISNCLKEIINLSNGDNRSSERKYRFSEACCSRPYWDFSMVFPVPDGLFYRS